MNTEPTALGGTPARIAVVSGYFNPIHIGHLRLMHGAQEVAPYVIALVNNDVQQMHKKGRIIMPESDRVEIVAELRSVSRAILTTDTDRTISKSLKSIRDQYPTSKIYFCNGGDRSRVESLPKEEATICAQLKIETVFGVGGSVKHDSSSRITGLIAQ